MQTKLFVVCLGLDVAAGFAEGWNFAAGSDFAEGWGLYRGLGICSGC